MERTRERVPLDWGTTQNNLGDVLPKRGQRESGMARIEEAITAFQAALEVFRPENAARFRAIANAKLELALAEIARRAAAAREPVT